jgi:hypothetical protein
MAIDNQVLAYGYMMEHTIEKYTYHFVGPHKLKTKKDPDPVTLVRESKIRRRATPYGFGITWDGFSSFQLSILAALGLSKTPSKK